MMEIGLIYYYLLSIENINTQLRNNSGKQTMKEILIP